MLTQKQEKFVQELIKGKSQREAYRAAYDCQRTSDKTVDENACRLFKNSKVSARYEELWEKVVEPQENEAIATAKEVLEELTAIGFGRKTFPALDMYGNPVDSIPNIPQRQKALEVLAKHHGLLVEKLQLEGDMALDIKIDYGGDCNADSGTN